MIRPAESQSPPKVHALSAAFLQAVKLAVKAEPPGVGFMRHMLEALINEFPEDLQMREFARKSVSEIARLLGEGHERIEIRRGLSHGLELGVDE